MTECHAVRLMVDRRQIIEFILGVDVIIMKNGTTRKITGIPDDAKIEHIYYDPTYDAFNLFLTHPSFPNIPDGGAVPLPLITVTENYSRNYHYDLTEENSGL